MFTRPRQSDSTDAGVRRVRTPALLLGAAGAAVAAVVLTACGGGSSSGSVNSSAAAQSTAPSTSAAAGEPNGRGNGQGRFGPAASGLVAAVNGSTAQVQGQDGQIAVTWSSSTKFTAEVSLAASSIKAGDCVTAIGETPTPPGSAPSSSPGTSSDAFTAATVVVTQATNGSCTAGGARGGGGFGGGNFGGGARPSGAPSGFPPGQRPSGFPTGARPSGGGGNGFARFANTAIGKVISTSGSAIVVASVDFGRFGGAPASSNISPSGTTPATTNKTVTLDSSTKVSTTKTATASAVKVGVCASAQGTQDDSGAVTATSIAITQPVNGSCQPRFGFRGGFGGGQQNSSAAGSSA